ncbi:hypothetical protein Pla175_33100 [Pirellulimonas nuda]|uniref:Bacterial type II secretion system protein I/J n=1 Tax=Pirellulimonas nuda TaxID=2528009 RepID=A0A518DEL5_9BACT|nr:hypothetical protein [Pirellulimonas nuda]QDU89913.1 hypothetical protein Pla175_33100 [Pirellulimonas nuda]
MRKRLGLQRPIASPRQAYSLLEVALAVALVGGTLVPALRVVRDGLELSRTTDRHQLLANFAVAKLEEQLGVIATTWTSGQTTGSFTAEGFASLRYVAVRSDSPADGGIASRLMNVTVTVFDDANTNATLDAGERNTVFRTKVARLATYVAS